MTPKSPSAQEQTKIASGNNGFGSFFYSLGFNSCLGLLVFLIFCILRPRYSRIFHPRKHFLSESNVVNLSCHKFKWVLELLRTPHEDLLVKCGVDAYCIVRFLYVCSRLFLLYALFFPALLIPLYVIDQKKLAGLDNASVSNLKDKIRIWGLAGSILILSVCTVGMVVQEFKGFLSIRQNYLLNLKTQSRTILLTNLPEEFRNSASLFSFLDPLSGGVEKVILCSETAQLESLVDQRQNLVLELEAFILGLVISGAKELNSQEPTAIIESPQDASSSKPWQSDLLEPLSKMLASVDASEGYGIDPDSLNPASCKITNSCQHISELNSAIQSLQKKLEHFPAKSAAFVSFNHPLGARLAEQIVTHEAPISVIGSMHPQDVLWDNLYIKGWEGKLRCILFRCFVTILILFWAIPVALVSSLASISALAEMFPPISIILVLPKWIVNFIEGILPPVFMSLLIQLLLKTLLMTTRWEGAKRYTDVQLSVMDKYFAFLLVNVLFVTTLSGGIVQAIQPLMANPSSILHILAQSIPKVANFFITFLLCQSLMGQMMELLSIGSIVTFFLKIRNWNNFTPRRVLTSATSYQPGWCWVWSMHTLVITISLSYATLAPSILFFAAIYFSLAYLVSLYKVSCVYQTQPESETGGLFFVKALKQVFVGVYISQVIVIGILMLHSLVGPILIAILALVGTILVHVRCNQKFLPLIMGLPVSTMVERLEPISKSNDTTTISDAATNVSHPSPPPSPSKVLEPPHPDITLSTPFSYRHPSLTAPAILPIWLPEIDSYPYNSVVPFLAYQIQSIKDHGIPVFIGHGATLDISNRSLDVSDP